MRNYIENIVVCEYFDDLDISHMNEWASFILDPNGTSTYIFQVESNHQQQFINWWKQIKNAHVRVPSIDLFEMTIIYSYVFLVIVTLVVSLSGISYF
jgi:hypothetical protein